MAQTARLRPVQEREDRERELTSLLDELCLTASELGLPAKVARRARAICVGAAAMRFCRVTPRPVIAAAALYVACREFQDPITLRDLAEAYGCDPREVGRCYTNMLERMHISRPSLNCGRYARRLVLERPLSDEVYRESERIIRRSALAGVCGRNPMTLAAAALYLSCCTAGEKITQGEVAGAAGVGEESVRECCKAIRLSLISTVKHRGSQE